MSPQNIAFGFGADASLHRTVSGPRHTHTRSDFGQTRKSSSESVVPEPKTNVGVAVDLQSGSDPLSTPSLVDVLNSLNLVSVDTGPRTGRRVSVNRVEANHTATNEARGESRSTSRKPSQAKYREREQPRVKRFESRSSSGYRTSSPSETPDLPSWTSLPVPPDSSTEDGTEYNEPLTTRPELFKIGPPRHAKKQLKRLTTPRQESRLDENQKGKRSASSSGTSKPPSVVFPAFRPASAPVSTPSPPKSPRSADEKRTPTGKPNARFDGVWITQPSPHARTKRPAPVKKLTPLEVFTSAHGLGRDEVPASPEVESSGGLQNRDGIDGMVTRENEATTPPPPSSSPSAGSQVLARADDTTGEDDVHEPSQETPKANKRAELLSTKPSSSFIGVVISKPSPRKQKASVPSGNLDLVSALEQAFSNDKDALAEAELHGSQDATQLRHFRRPRNGMMMPPAVVLRQADIDASLGTRVAPLHVPRPGGPSWANLDEWERTMYGEAAGRRLKVCLRHVEERLGKVEEKLNRDDDNERPVFAVPEQSRTRLFIERLIETFGPGSIHRGAGPKPKTGLKQQGAEELIGILRTRLARAASVSDSENGWNDVMDHVLLGKRTRSAVSDSEDETRPRTKMKLDGDVTEVEVDTEKMNEWAAALQKLVKGKMSMEREELQALGAILDEIEAKKDVLELQDLTDTRVIESVEEVSVLSEIPFDDHAQLRPKASHLVQFWQNQVV